MFTGSKRAERLGRVLVSETELERHAWCLYARPQVTTSCSVEYLVIECFMLGMGRPERHGEERSLLLYSCICEEAPREVALGDLGIICAYACCVCSLVVCVACCMLYLAA